MKLFAVFVIITMAFQSVFVRAEGLRLDHAIIAVDNLEIANSTFKSLGFSIKQGKLHPNGLLNSHIKFIDSTELELISITTNPTDFISKAYRKFLTKEGEGGAFVALSGVSITYISARLAESGIDHQVLRGQLWDYLIFPEKSGLEHLFFIERHRLFTNDRSVYQHENGVNAIHKILVEGDNRLENLLKILNIRPCEVDSASIGDGVAVYELSGADLVVIRAQKQHTRYRFLGVGFDKSHLKMSSDVAGKHGIIIVNDADYQCME